MSTLALWTLILGGLKTVFAGWAWTRPIRAKAMLDAFPRSTWPARLLTAADLIWASYYIYDMPLGPADPYKVYLWALCPISIVLLCVFMDDLLAPRALGGFYLLLATPVLDAARWHPSPWRLVVTVSMYIMIVFGMWLILAPYRLRHLVERFYDTPEKIRRNSAMGVAVGLAFILLALFVY